MKTTATDRCGGRDLLLWRLTIGFAFAGILVVWLAVRLVGGFAIGGIWGWQGRIAALAHVANDESGKVANADKATKATKATKAGKTGEAGDTGKQLGQAADKSAATLADQGARKNTDKNTTKDGAKDGEKDGDKNGAASKNGKTAAKPATGEPAEMSYMRVRRGANKAAEALETSILRFERAEPGKPAVLVDLVGVIHIGEREYYDELNKLFKDYDAVLYELVAPEGTRIPKGGGKGGANPISALQKGLQSMLSLEYQLEHIDYHAPNFIHADMTPEEMSKSMTDRKESWFQMMLRMMGQGMAQQPRQAGGDINLIGALFAKDRPTRMKRIFAQQFEGMEGMSAFDGPEGSTLITERNKKALRVLDRELMAGKQRVAIFYGAGHMKDMEDRLLNEFKMRRVSATWLTAWRMSGSTNAAKPEAAKPEAGK
jgi:hypothetical protein